MPQKQLKDKKFSELKWGSREAYSFRNDNIIKSDIFSKNWNKKESTDMPKSSSIGECYQIWKKENQNSLNPLTFHRYNNLLQRISQNMKLIVLSAKNRKKICPK